MNCLTKLSHPSFPTLHSGKVRDSLRFDEHSRLIVVTDRISAFNLKIKTPIPHKGAVLTAIANFWFSQTQHIIPNHIIRQIDPNITLVKEAQPIKVEMVVRAYLTGSMWRGYQDGQRTFSGVSVPNGMQQNQAFPTPIITPTTKDDFDTEVDEQMIIENGLASPQIYEQMKQASLALFGFGSQYLAQRGIILVDTKYEFGLLNGQLILIDEIQTPDSSRFWRTTDYQANPQTAEQIDKEFLRQWLLKNTINGEIPTTLPDEIANETSRRYQEIYQIITGTPFVPPQGDIMERINQNLQKLLDNTI
ncbi:MAG: phosphoribosylaminoimidazolesuccinocarboxamide synthase [Sphingobacteriales bacterium]|nr:phosphoribosylaminoimidazolesuccinocarboxamide synthase [Sphingobacteriales bacterium]